MSEHVRTIEQHEFDAGIATRLRLGELAAGHVVLVRLEVPKEVADREQDFCIEMDVTITDVIQKDDGGANVIYKTENPDRKGEYGYVVRDFDSASVGHRTDYGRTFRTYFADHLSGDWDGALEALVDETLQVAR